MNRRGFLQSLAAIPLAGIAVAVSALPDARRKLLDGKWIMHGNPGLTTDSTVHTRMTATMARDAYVAGFTRQEIKSGMLFWADEAAWR